MDVLRRDRRFARFIVKGKVTGRHLGTGPYGSVEEIEVNGLLHVGKMIHKHLITTKNVTVEDIARKYSQECEVMLGLRHPNITVFIGLSFVPNCQFPLLVMEKLDGSLDDLLETIPEIPLALKRSLLEDVARGLLYLHSHSPQIIHMDLTAKNVLLTTSLEAKISDFGNSYVVNVQPDFRATSLSTLAYISPEAMNEAPQFSPSLDVFSFGHLILFTLTQVFSNDLPEIEYVDPSDPNKPLRRSEVERRAKYFDLLEDKVVKGQNHPLAQLSQDCLKNNPVQRPSAEQLLAALEDIEEEVEGPYGEFTKLDAVRQVAAMKSLLERDIEVREKAEELKLMGEKVRRLHKKLKEAEQTTDERLEAELHKDVEIEVKEAQIKELQQDATELKKQVEQMEGQLHYRDTLLQQKDLDMQQKDEEVHKTEDKIKEKDGILELRNAELNYKDEEVIRRDVRIILKTAELKYKDGVLQQRDVCLHQKISELQERHSQLTAMDSKLQQLQNELEEKTAKLNEKDSILNSKDDNVHQVNALLQQKSKELRQRDKELQLKVEELQLKDTIIKSKNGELCTTEEQLCQLTARLEQLKTELQQRDVKLQEVQSESSKLLEELQEKEAELQIKESELQEKLSQLKETCIKLECKDKELIQKCEELQLKDKDLEQKCVELNCKDGELYQKTLELQLKDERLNQKEGEFQDKDQKLQKVVDNYKEKLHQANKQLEHKDVELKQAIDELKLKEAEIKQKSVLISKKDNELKRREEDIQKLDTKLQQLNEEIQQKNEDLKRKASQIITIQEQMQKDTELHQKQTQIKESQLSTIMDHIYQLQEAQEELRTDLDQRNADVSRLQEELVKMKERPQILAATGQVSASRLLPSELPLKVEWRNGKDMPHGLRYHPQAVVLHGKIYLGGGKSDRNTQVMTYDPRHELWATLPPYQYELFAMASIEDQLVLVGGEDARSRKKTNVLGVWDEKLHYWTHPFPPMVTSCSSPTVVNYQDKWLIVAGGSGEGGDLFIVEVMDIANNHWYSAPPLPIPASKMSATIIDDNTMIVLGGASGYYFFKKAFKVNLDELISQAIAQQTTVSHRRLHAAVPSQTPWQKLPDTPFTQSAAVTFRGSLLAVGGQGGPSIHLYHPESRSWVKAGDLPSERVQCACTMLPNGELFLAGGANTEELVEVLTIV